MVLSLLGLGGAERQQASLFQLIKDDNADELLAKLQHIKLPAGGLDEIRGGEHNCTLLQEAVWRAKPRCVQVLMRQGASCTKKDEDGRTVLHLLVLGAHHQPEHLKAAVSLQQQLLSTLSPATCAQLDVTDRDGTPLLLALMCEIEPLARGFLKAGFSVSATLQRDKSSVLHLATLPGNAGLRADLMQVVEQTGQLQGMMSQSTLQGTTPLHAAVSAQIPDMVSRMLKLPHIKTNTQDGSGCTPLHLAMTALSSSSPSNRGVAAELVLLLLEHKAGIDIPDREGNTCLGLAIKLAMLVLSKKVKEDTDPLLQPFMSIARGHGEVVNGDEALLFDTLSEEEGVCAMHVAAMLGEISLVSGLINRGAKVDIQDAEGQLPSILAAKARHKTLLIALFGPLGADPLLLDKHGMSAVAHLLLDPSKNITQDDLKDIMLAAVDSPNLPENVAQHTGKGLAVHPVCRAAPGELGPLPLLPLACVTGNLEIVKALVEEGRMLPDMPSSTQATPLSTTVAALCSTPTDAAKFLPTAEYLVQMGASPVRQCGRKHLEAITPLGVLIDHGHLDAVITLLKHAKQHVDFKSPSGATALYLAIVQGNVAAVRELVSQLGAHAGPQPLFTPLHVAVGCQQPAVVQFLLGNAEARSVINQLDCHKRTPLAYCWTAWRTDALAAGHVLPAAKARSMDVNATQVQLVQLLLEQPDCDPNTPVDASGKRVLHLATEQGSLELVKMIAGTTHGLDPNLQDASGMSPLSRAVQRGDVAFVQALASLPEWRQPLQVDMHVIKTCMQLLDTKPSVCESILAVLLNPTHASKCSIDLSDTSPCTLPVRAGTKRLELPLLHYVARMDNALMVELLIKQGKVAVTTTDSRGLTALHHAVACKAMTAANALVNNGADISALGNAPTTPLTAAVQDLDVGMVALLLSSTNGHDINVKDSQGHTAVTMLIQKLFESSHSRRPLSRPSSQRTPVPDSPVALQPSSCSNLAAAASSTAAALSTGDACDATADVLMLSSAKSSASTTPKLDAPSAPLDLVSNANSMATHPCLARKASGLREGSAAGIDILQQLLRKGADANPPLPWSTLSESMRALPTQLSHMVATRSTLPPASQCTSPTAPPSPAPPPSPQLPTTSHTPPSPQFSPSLSLRSSASLRSRRWSSSRGLPSNFGRMDCYESELCTPLLLAIQLRNEQVLEVLLQEAHKELDINGEHSWPAVQVAIQCVQLLIAQKPTPEPQQPTHQRESRRVLDRLLSRDTVAAAAAAVGVNAGNADEAVEAAVRILERILKQLRVDLTKPFEGMLLQHVAGMSEPHALRIVRLLLSAPGMRANINARHPKTASTALHTAAIKNDKEMIEVLANVKAIDFNILDSNGHTPLAVAVQAGARDVIPSLLQLGLSNDLAADILDPTKCGQDPATSPIALAITNPEHRVLQTLVTGLSMANNKIAQEYGYMLYPPQKSSKNSSEAAAAPAPAQSSLIAARQYDIEAVLNQPIDQAGRTPVLLACKALRLDHAQVLVKTERQTWPGAALDVAEPDADSPGADTEFAGSTPLHMVLEHAISLKAECGNSSIQGQLTRACVLASDMASAPSMATAVGMKDAVGFTPLHWAVMAKLDDVVQILCPKARKLGCIDASADTDKGQGTTPLHLAVQLDHLGCARHLLLHGADLETVLHDGITTPLHLCEPDQLEMRLLLMNPPEMAAQSSSDAAGVPRKRGILACGYDAIMGPLAYTWGQVKDMGKGGGADILEEVDFNTSIQESEEDAERRAASKALYQTFRSSLDVLQSAKEVVGPISTALASMCLIADELLEGVSKLAFSNMLVAHLAGRINRQVPTLQNLKRTLEQTKNHECAKQLLPHIHQLGEVYIEIHEMVDTWSCEGYAPMLARIFASQEFWDGLVLKENILTGCMTDVSTVVNSFHMMGLKINAERDDPEKAREGVRNLIRQDMQMAMQHMLEVEAMGGDVSEAQASAVKMFKEYGLDYNSLKKKEQRKWKGDKLKELIIAPSQLQILGKVGTGGSAQVFRAMYEGHPVAYKQFEAMSHQSDLLQKYVENEAYIMSQLRHPNIIQIFGMVGDKCSSQYGLVVDYHAPGSLQNMIDSRTRSAAVSVQERVALVLQIARGMAYLHTRSVEPIIHGDLKPSNVLVSEDGRAVITDFGLSRITSNSTTTTAVHAHSNTFTSDASTVYTAPEVPDLLLSNKRRAPSTDVFSFGVLCLELLTLQPCYTGFAASPEEYTRKVSQGLRPRIPDEIPALLSRCIQLCWHHEPEDRPSFTDIVDVLDHAFASII